MHVLRECQAFCTHNYEIPKQKPTFNEKINHSELQPFRRRNIFVFDGMSGKFALINSMLGHKAWLPTLP
jgi:hypothetical protein